MAGENKITIEMVDGSGGKSPQGSGAPPPSADVGKPPPQSQRTGASPVNASSGAANESPGKTGVHADLGKILSFGKDLLNKNQFGQQATSILDRYKGHFQRPKASAKAPSIGMPPKTPASAGTSPGNVAAQATSASGKGGATAMNTMATSAEDAAGGIGRFAGALGRAVPIIAGIVVVGKAVEAWMNYRTKMIGLEANTVSAGLADRGQGRRLGELEESKNAWYGNLVPFWETVYNRREASEKALMQKQQAFRGRSASLSQYDTGLSKEFARSEIAYQRADIGQAQILGPKLAEVERSTRELELVEQQTQAANALKDAAKMLTENQDRLNKEKDRLEDALKDLTEVQKQQIREMGKKVKSPLQTLFDSHGFKTPESAKHGSDESRAKKKSRN